MIVALSVVVVLLAVALAAVWALLVQFAAQQGRLLMRLESLEAGDAAPADGACGGSAVEEAPALALGAPFPAFTRPDLEGTPLSLDDVAGGRVLVVNWSPSCGFCGQIASTLAKLERPLRRHGVGLVLVASGDAEANRRLARSHGLGVPILLQGADGPVEAFRGVGTPAAYLVDEERRVASARALGAEEVPALARELAGRGKGLRLRPLGESRIRRDGLPPGSRAPGFALPSAEGGTVSLDDYRGRRVLLVFSDPHCPPCDEVAPRLARLHRELEGGDPAIVMVGRGDPEENRRKAERHGIEFPVALQRASKLSKAYGIFSWPVAFLIDEAGVIAEPVAIGPDAILALARQGTPAREEAAMEI